MARLFWTRVSRLGSLTQAAAARPSTSLSRTTRRPTGPPPRRAAAASPKRPVEPSASDCDHFLGWATCSSCFATRACSGAVVGAQPAWGTASADGAGAPGGSSGTVWTWTTAGTPGVARRAGGSTCPPRLVTERGDGGAGLDQPAALLQVAVVGLVEQRQERQEPAQDGYDEGGPGDGAGGASGVQHEPPAGELAGGAGAPAVQGQARGAGEGGASDGQAHQDQGGAADQQQDGTCAPAQERLPVGEGQEQGCEAGGQGSSATSRPSGTATGGSPRAGGDQSAQRVRTGGRGAQRDAEQDEGRCPRRRGDGRAVQPVLDREHGSHGAPQR